MDRFNIMTEIMGSIDNAANMKGIFSLIFIPGEMLKFEIMNNKERKFEVYQARMMGGMSTLPSDSGLNAYNIRKEQMENMILENIGRGQDIEKNLDSYLEKKPAEYESFPYENIIEAELSSGTAFTLPHVIFRLKDEHMKFHLIHGNFSGSGKIPEEVFKKYEDILRISFKDRLSVG